MICLMKFVDLTTFLLTVLDIALEDNQLRAAKATVLEYANLLIIKHQKRLAPNAIGDKSEAKSEACIVFHGMSQALPASERPPAKVVQAIERLWLSSGVQQVYQRRNEFQQGDSADYFLNNVSKFTADNFVPSNQDILKARVRTQSIVKVN